MYSRDCDKSFKYLMTIFSYVQQVFLGKNGRAWLGVEHTSMGMKMVIKFIAQENNHNTRSDEERSEVRNV